MRISALPDDPGVWAPPGTEVYCDGLKMRDVVTADEEAGFVMHLKTNEKGDYLIAPNLGLSVFRTFGKVIIHFPKGYGGA